MDTRASSAIGLDPDDPITVTVINTIIKPLGPLYVDIMITCIWSAMLVPLFVVLIFFSNRELRKKPVFIGNVLAISVGISFAGFFVGQTLSMLLNPLTPHNIPLFLIVILAFFALGPMLVEAVLLIRLWAAYPFKTTPRNTFFAIYIPIALLKISRLANAIAYLVTIAERTKGGQNIVLLLHQTWSTFPHYKIGWTMQVVDNALASGLFLAKLNRGRALRSVAGAQLASKLDSLFWIAVYNFVIPVILSVVELIVIWTTDIFRIFPICIVNLYVEILGVLLATVWAAGVKWQDTHKSATRNEVVDVLTTVDVDVNMSPVSQSSKNSTAF